MKTLLASLALFGFAVSAVLGQGVSIEVALDQEQYLPGEALPVRVRITNFTGQNLRLGGRHVADVHSGGHAAYCRAQDRGRAGEGRIHP